MSVLHREGSLLRTFSSHGRTREGRKLIFYFPGGSEYLGQRPDEWYLFPLLIFYRFFFDIGTDFLPPTSGGSIVPRRWIICRQKKLANEQIARTRSGPEIKIDARSSEVKFYSVSLTFQRGHEGRKSFRRGKKWGEKSENIITKS